MCFEKIKKIDKPLAKLTKGHRDSIQAKKIRNEKYNNRNWENLKNHRSYYKSPYSTKVEDLDAIYKVLDRYHRADLNQE